MIAVVSTTARAAFHYPGEDLRPTREPKVRLQGAAQQIVETGRLRLIVTAGLFGIAFALIGARLVELMAINAGPAVLTARTAGAAPAVTGARADILDRNGNIIATNLPTVNLYADAKLVPDAKAAADKLVAALPDLKYDDTFRRLGSGQRFVYLRRHLTPPEQAAVNRLGIPGVYFEKAERRVYPQGPLFAHVVGFTDPDNRGISGVEKTFESILAGRQEPVRLSLDLRAQHAVRESLAAGIARYKARAGSAVVMDVNTGEVVAMVSLPDYDPKATGEAPEDARFNRATLGLYEMGSTFKLFTAAMSLDAGKATLTSRYDATDPIQIGRFTINDYRGQHRWLVLPEVLIHSSNIAAAKMALEAGTKTQQSYLRAFGLLSPLGLELPEVGTPQYPSTWRDINTMTIAYGHGISVTPVHVVSAVSAVVNGGILYPPTIIRREPGQAPDGHRVISEQTSDTMRAIMRLVVMEGSGKNADIAGYQVGGKTGSAQKVSRSGGYTEASLRTSFVAAFPLDAPRYVVLVVLDEPQATKETFGFRTAGWNSVPTVGGIVSKIAPMLGVFPTGHRDDFKPLPQLLQASAAGWKAAPMQAAMQSEEITTDIFDQPASMRSAADEDVIGVLIGSDGEAQ